MTQQQSLLLLPSRECRCACAGSVFGGGKIATSTSYSYEVRRTVLLIRVRVQFGSYLEVTRTNAYSRAASSSTRTSLQYS
eukprot:scaffold666463_cov57-Prasinocladus_malaysianus.AAC.1